MRSLAELVNREEPAWPLVKQWISETSVSVEVLPADPATADCALLATQVSTRSPMGAIAHGYAGLLIDAGWLRVLGAGSHPRFQRSLPGWNEGRSSGFYLVADDAVGGSFAINGGALGEDRGNVYYYAPDSLLWEPCQFGYSDFLLWSMSSKFQEFCASLRWEGWQGEVCRMTGDQAINFYPFLWAQGPPLKDRHRGAVPMDELYRLQLDFQRQFGIQ
jgi:hypothetical protein